MSVIEVRKSSLMDYLYCPLKYKYAWVERRERRETFESRVGKVFHAWAEEFWTRVPDEPESLEQLEELVPIEAIPQVRELMAWFVELEWQRWVILRQKGRADLWKPLATELELKGVCDFCGEEVKCTGHIDRVDLLEDGTVAVIEYKTTRSMNLTKLRKELWYYKVLVEATRAWQVSKIVVINPMRREVFVEMPKKPSYVALCRLVKRLKESHETGEFPPSPGEHCLWCDYRDICPFAGLSKKTLKELVGEKM